MSEQENNQQQGEDKLLAGKYKSQDELEKGYIELSKKLGEQSKQPSAAPAKQDDSASTEDYAWKSKNAALDMQQTILNQRKAEASKALEDSNTLTSVRAALGSSDAINQFQKEFDEGQVSAAEVKRLAKLGGKPQEANETIPPKVEEKKTSAETDHGWMMTQLKDLEGPYFDKNHSDHAATRQRVEAIRKNL